PGGAVRWGGLGVPRGAVRPAVGGAPRGVRWAVGPERQAAPRDVRDRGLVHGAPVEPQHTEVDAQGALASSVPTGTGAGSLTTVTSGTTARPDVGRRRAPRNDTGRSAGPGD